MKKNNKWRMWAALAMGVFCFFFLIRKETILVQAAAEDTILSGVYVEGMDMSGMTEEEARAAIQSYVNNILEDDELIYLQYNDVAEHMPTGIVLGGYWSNEELLEELMQLGKSGHVVDRYKFRKDLEKTPAEYRVEISFDLEKITSYIEKTFKKYDQKVRNVSLTRKDNKFEITEGITGCEVDVTASAIDVYEYLNLDWNRSKAYLPLEVAVIAPMGSEEELAQITDIIGSYTTTFKGGTADKIANIANGARLINDITMYPGEEFSFDAYAAPYTVDNGFVVGKAYESGRLVDSIGGGVCQVSSTLYNTVLRAELEVTMRYNHSMIVGYVPISSDATLAETSGKDFRFKNNLDAPIYVEAYTTKDHRLIVNIYGKETRPAGRTVEYISETLEVINPGPDVIKTDGTKPVGHVEASSAYTGYKAKLWKVVKINGTEQSRELVNSSNYRAVARMATVGMYTTDPAVLEQMNAAVATGNIDHVKNVAAMLTAPPAAQ